MTEAADVIERLLTCDEVAEALQVSKDWVYRAARTGVLPSVSLGRNTRFRAADVQAFVSGYGTARDLLEDD